MITVNKVLIVLWSRCYWLRQGLNCGYGCVAAVVS